MGSGSAFDESDGTQFEKMELAAARKSHFASGAHIANEIHLIATNARPTSSSNSLAAGALVVARGTKTSMGTL